MATEHEAPTGSQLLGGLIGAGVGNFKGTAVGGAAAFALMAAPLTGPLAILAIPAIFLLPVGGAVAGTVVGAKLGSKGIGHAMWMLLGAVPQSKC